MESFLAIGQFVAGTRRLEMVHESIAASIEGSAAVRRFELPFDATPVSNAIWWHPIHDHDVEHEWMRGLFIEAAAGLPRV